MAGTALSAGLAGGEGGDSGFFSEQAEREIVAARIRAIIIDKYLRIGPHFFPPAFMRIRG
ncbi:MAG: hypothetical protein HW377_2469 [Actinobacteria bacterium]|nr:hypothetical protein [Actinomycetota bacterium]